MSAGRIASVATFVAALVLSGSAAFAQLPPTPALPAPPKPVTDAIAQVEGTVYPVVFQAVEAGEPVAQAGGFALRPACSTAGYAAFLIAVGGAGLPVPVIGLASPAFLFCAYTFEPGPADPVLEDADAAIGPSVSDGVEPLERQVHDGTDPIRSDLAVPCGLSAFLVLPSTLPPPTNRVDVVGTIC